MQNPGPINLWLSHDVRTAGWQAECRDSDGHLTRTHAPFETDEDIVWLVREALSHGDTVTIWPPKDSVAFRNEVSEAIDEEQAEITPETPSQRFARALTEMPKLANAADCYVAIKVYASKAECDKAGGR